jgi:hypothetical protein
MEKDCKSMRDNTGSGMGCRVAMPSKGSAGVHLQLVLLLLGLVGMA